MEIAIIGVVVWVSVLILLFNDITTGENPDKAMVEFCILMLASIPLLFLLILTS